VSRWQIAQPARERVVVRIVRKSRFTYTTEEAIRRRLGNAIGGTVALEVALVDEIPLAPDGAVRPVLTLALSPRTDAAGGPLREAVR